KWGGFLEGVNEFDPLFFHISRKEAEFMDPQERLFLECVYETLEDAGYTKETLGTDVERRRARSVGVYVGVMYQEYQLYGAQETIKGNPMALSGSSSSIANRVSYFCNFQGPSVAVDTMCSSSLTAIHFACQSLKLGECETAIAGGVNISIHPNKYLALGQGKFASSNGRCASFGEDGDGYVPGEGVGAVLLKPLDRAIADGDRIYGVITASAINHGGKTNGYTVPNPHAQAEVIRQTLEQSGVHPRTISYVEAHGTGTSLGDPIEIAGLSGVFSEYSEDKQFCAIGSVKSNIGHCESAAGIAGLTKVLLQMKHRQLVPSLHARKLNPNIDFSSTPFVVQQQLVEWKRPKVNIGGTTKEYPLIAGLSSFGAGGSNAHLMIREYTPTQPSELSPVPPLSSQPALVVLSAKNEKRLREQAQQLLSAIRERDLTDDNLADLAYTLQVGREAMEERWAALASSMKELETRLDGFVASRTAEGTYYRGRLVRGNGITQWSGDDENFADNTQRLAAGQKYDELLAFWVQGLDVDWSLLYGKSKPRRIGLPTYPFARERYGVPGTGSRQHRAGGIGSNADSAAVKMVEAAPTAFMQPDSSANPAFSLIKSTESSAKVENTETGTISLLPLSEYREIKRSAEPNWLQRPLIPLAAIEDVNYVSLSSRPMAEEEDSQKMLPTVPSVDEQEPRHEPPWLDATEGTAASGAGTFSLNVLMEELTASLAEAMMMEPEELDIHSRFTDIGVDSIIGVEWIKAVNRTYGTSITVAKVYDYSTIADFALYLQGQLQSVGAANSVTVAESQPMSQQMLHDQVQEIEWKKTVSGFNAAEWPQPGLATRPEVQPLINSKETNAVSIEQLQLDLTESLAEAMFMHPDEVCATSNFTDIGVDSIIGVEWIKAVNQKYGTSITATKIYDYPNIIAFSALLSSEIDKQTGESRYGTELGNLEDILAKVVEGKVEIGQADQWIKKIISEEGTHD
ncbi:type I polyketide synthase, partial [Paenibacillus forsythiae]